jgi:hypothetical protein
MEEADVMRLWEEALANESNPRKGVSPESFSIVVLKNRIGGYGVGMFDVQALD